MLNLTQEQKALLAWMSEGRSFEVCSDYCTTNGEVAGKSRLPIRVFRSTLNKLYQEGLIAYQAQLHYNIRWDVFTLTEKGKALA
ncbi:hypothetical protein P0F09_000697 [Vibrio metschnikovii]|uniref:hypothetical protein n=1 Tax=Vibrio metschnikovii TaxID=28172 RepID=UPI00287ACD43|nr:hypothetical protein [Vibrio metschnikovii]EKO3567071.1 hypothetical protein [Vibrio metschnikovii]EKO3602273.1 hypothetical protein [Vibrio metschnikovii]EKO3762936.1 hypothetical protein [Vibrio metschnikovii]EKQ5809720.1 hypothetical protein [Vibrio metschnikovii]